MVNGSKLGFPMSVALAVRARNEEPEKCQLMRMLRQLARRGMADIGEDRPTALLPCLNRSVEASCSQCLGAIRLLLVFRHSSPPWARLSLF